MKKKIFIFVLLLLICSTSIASMQKVNKKYTNERKPPIKFVDERTPPIIMSGELV